MTTLRWPVPLRLQPDLNQAADGFGTSKLRPLLFRNPFVEGIKVMVMHLHQDPGPRARRLWTSDRRQPRLADGRRPQGPAAHEAVGKGGPGRAAGENPPEVALTPSNQKLIFEWIETAATEDNASA